MCCHDFAGNGHVQLITFDGDLLWTQQLTGGGILSLALHLDERCIFDMFVERRAHMHTFFFAEND
jgi:hypothetical protein